MLAERDAPFLAGRQEAAAARARGGDPLDMLRLAVARYCISKREMLTTFVPAFRNGTTSAIASASRSTVLAK